jgi:hypothetical protein
MKATSRAKTITSISSRARHYRLAAAMSDARRDVEMFLDLAMMFERLAEEFTRAKARLRLVRA